ncbi:MAG: PhzF family phenazine biosynthesis protein [Candidatus Binatia bacterium]
MARHEYRLVDVFTTERFGGNPLAVFPHADTVGQADMQRIARELNLSETTFVQPATHPECDFRVRIFAPRCEMPMAGHPTIGTAWVLDHGARVVFQENVGPIEVERVTPESAGNIWRMAQPLPAWGPRLASRAAAAAIVGLEAEDIDPALPVEVVSTGAPFLFVPLRDRAALGRARVSAEACERVAELAGTYGVFCFTTDSGAADATVRSRMFAPAVGVPEDPATGSGSGALGCYLVRYGVVAAGAPARMLSLQGVEMGRPSRIHIEIAGQPDAITAVRVAGACVAVGGGYIEL